MTEISIGFAKSEDVKAIINVCSLGYSYTTKDCLDQETVQQNINSYYNENRVRKEIAETSPGWQGWVVARKDNEIIGAAGGGMIADDTGMLYVIYLKLDQRRNGIGKMLTEKVTEMQKQAGAAKQTVSVLKSNEEGIRFYKKMGFIFLKESIDEVAPEFTACIYKRTI